jgi:DNA ligase 1
MRRFAALYQQLDASTATGDKVAALVRYFDAAPPADAAWALYFLAGGKPRQVVPTALAAATGHRARGHRRLAVRGVLPGGGRPRRDHRPRAAAAAAAGDAGLAHWVEQRLLPLRALAPEEQAARLARASARWTPAGASCSSS